LCRRLGAIAPVCPSLLHNPCTYNVTSWFQSLRFKWVNLYRYAAAEREAEHVPQQHAPGEAHPRLRGGACTIWIQFTHSLKPAWFQPSNLQCDILVFQSFFFQNSVNLYRRYFEVKMGFGLHVGWAIEGAIGSEYKVGGCTSLEFRVLGCRVRGLGLRGAVVYLTRSLEST
jgi:hypothetical protein